MYTSATNICWYTLDTKVYQILSNLLLLWAPLAWSEQRCLLAAFGTRWSIRSGDLYKIIIFFNFIRLTTYKTLRYFLVANDTNNRSRINLDLTSMRHGHYDRLDAEFCRRVYDLLQHYNQALSAFQTEPLLGWPFCREIFLKAAQKTCRFIYNVSMLSSNILLQCVSPLSIEGSQRIYKLCCICFLAIQSIDWNNRLITTGNM